MRSTNRSRTPTRRSRRPTRSSNTPTPSIGLSAGLVGAAAFVILGAASAQAAPKVLTLPPPTGPLPVGVVDLHLIDADRLDPWHPGRGHRELMVTVRYPAQTPVGAAVAPQMSAVAAADYARRAPTTLGLRRRAVDWTATATHSHPGVPVDRGAARLPVVLFSPGFQLPRTLSTVLLEDLASRGYVVVSVDHTYEPAQIEFPGGRLVGPGLPRARTPRAIDRLLAKALQSRRADLAFVLDQLEAISAGRPEHSVAASLPPGLPDALDLGKVGVFGHSLGGALAAQLVADDPRVLAGADLDGSLFGPVVRTGVAKPFLLMAAQGTSRGTEPSWASFLDHSTGPVTVHEIPGSAHLSFMDAQALLPQLSSRLRAMAIRPAIGTVSPQTSIDAQRRQLADLFDSALAHRPTPATSVTAGERGRAASWSGPPGRASAHDSRERGDAPMGSATMRSERAMSLARLTVRPRRRPVLVIGAIGALSFAGPGVSTAAAKPTIVFPDGPDEGVVAPAIKTFKLRSDLDDLAIRPDGTIAVATQTNSNEARPTATIVRFGPLAQLPTLRMFGPDPAAETTQAAVTPTGGVVAWTMDAEGSPVTVRETSDDGTATVPQQLSAPGLSAWPNDTASGGGAVAVLYSEHDPAAKALNVVRLAYRAPAAATYTSARVPIRPALRDFWESKLVVGPSGDGAIAIWSNEHHTASLWRVERDGTVGPELPVALKSKGWVDVRLAVGTDGTIAAAFGIADDRRSDQVVIAHVPAGSGTLAPLARVKASSGASLATQGMGLAVSPTGRLLFSVEEAGAQVIVEGSGSALKTIYTPYTAGSPAAAAWLPDGTAAVVFETEASPTDEGTQLVSLRRAPGTDAWQTKLIGPGITPRAKPPESTDSRLPPSAASVRNLSLVPAADGTAALAWEVWPGRGRPSVGVARVTP